MAVELNGSLSREVISPVVPDTSGRAVEQNKSRGLAGPLAPVGMQDSVKSAPSADGSRTDGDKNTNDLELAHELLVDARRIADLKGWSVNFERDDELGRTIIRVVDAKTNDLIRQIPSEEWLTFVKKWNQFDSNNEQQKGLFLDETI